MALRTFRSNPSLGGFGNESTPLPEGDNQARSSVAPSGDAFAQIVKELVDNAVDACCAGTSEVSSFPDAPKKRVRVMIEPFPPNHMGSEEKTEYLQESDDILRITVTDNGVGMENIQSCVDPFYTSKAQANQGTNPNTSPSRINREEGRTVGRYGIGLTLCLLHAQRLVPNTCTSIKSARPEHSHWTHVTCVVDTDQDTVRCIREEQVTKQNRSESGTSVSLLVPGGRSAMLGWQRLAEYFARFKLSLGLKCSLEVLAPSLSKIPLFIQPVHMDTFQGAGHIGRASKEQGKATKERNIRQAVSHYLGRPIDLRNVAYSTSKIRIINERLARQPSSGPTLDVALVVHGPDDEAEEEEHEQANNQIEAPEKNSAKMVLVRMVNDIPLLDSAEAAACGLVHSIAAKKGVWQSFGLEVNIHSNHNDFAKLLTFDVRDSDQVAPFFQRGAHSLLQNGYDSIDNDGDGKDTFDGESEQDGTKRKRIEKFRRLLPAQVRLGNILFITHIQAEPSVLPLPTLSKGRLPVDDSSIDIALEVGLANCLKQLQKTNPNLLLTATELRKAERDARYVPAVSAALASVVCNASEPNQDLIDRVLGWGQDSTQSANAGVTREFVEDVGSRIESRLRSVLRPKEKSKRGKVQNQSDGDDDASNDSKGSCTSFRSLFNDVLQSQRPCLDDANPAPSRVAAEQTEEYDDWM